MDVIKFGSRRNSTLFGIQGEEPSFSLVRFGLTNPYSINDPDVLRPDEDSALYSMNQDLYSMNQDLYSMNIVKHILKVQECDLSNLMCLSCIEAEFVRLLKPIETHIARLAEVDRICRPCAAIWATLSDLSLIRIQDRLAPEAPYRCADCGAPICLYCKDECAGCKKPICKSHESKRCSACQRKRGWFTRLCEWLNNPV